MLDEVKGQRSGNQSLLFGLFKAEHIGMMSDTVKKTVLGGAAYWIIKHAQVGLEILRRRCSLIRGWILESGLFLKSLAIRFPALWRRVGWPATRPVWNTARLSSVSRPTGIPLQTLQCPILKP